jgi:VWFA-related protein
MSILRRTLRLAFTAALLSLCAHAALAQTPEGFGEKVSVNQVLIDALVTDAQGNVVLGLDKNDFVVRQNGEPVELDSAVFYSNRRFLESSQAARQLGLDPTRVPDNRYFILLFHDQRRDFPRSEPTQIMEAAHRARDWVGTELSPNDFVAVLSYDYKLKLQQDFTRDRDALVKAINRAIQGQEGTWPSREVAAEGPSLAAALPQGTELRDRTVRFYDGVKLLAEAARGVPGRKNLVLFSRGYGETSAIARWQPDPRYYPGMVQALNQANVAVYAIDVHPRPSSPRHLLADSLSQLAGDTAGRYYSNFTSFSTPLAGVVRETNGYYLLSFTPKPGKGFQTVKVELKNLELKVHARRGFEPTAG